MKCVYGWAGVRYVITKFSRMDSLPYFVTHGAPLRALRARESSTIIVCKTLKKEGRAFRNIGKKYVYFPDCKISLASFV